METRSHRMVCCQPGCNATAEWHLAWERTPDRHLHACVEHAMWLIRAFAPLGKAVTLTPFDGRAGAPLAGA